MNGVRTEKKSSSKANVYQPTTLLDLVVYHTPHKNLQRIKEARVNHIYQTLQSHIVKNTIAVYLSELIHKTISEPETNPELFDFFENSFLRIDRSAESDLSNFPITFTLQLAKHLGFGIHNEYSENDPILDLQNGQFCTKEEVSSFYFAEGENARLISLLNVDTPVEIPSLNQDKRKELLAVCIRYLRLHIPHMSELKSVEVLHEILS